MPVPTGDLEAAFQATGAPNIVAYAATADPAVLNPQISEADGAGKHTFPSYGWARGAGPDGATAEAFLRTGDSYDFTAAASVRAVEETLAGTARGALSPAESLRRRLPPRTPEHHQDRHGDREKFETPGARLHRGSR